MKVARKQTGFTLLELMITVVILVILVSIGVPSYQSAVRNNCAVSGGNSMLSLLVLAKSEAQRRGRSITVCPSNSAGDGCAASATDWSVGLVAYVDVDKDHSFDSGEELIRSITPLSTCSAITTNLGSYLSFDSLAKPGNQGNFTITPNGQSQIKRKLVVSQPSKLRICNPATDSTC